jgi:thiol-disulfide isomerase/thioredoxin
LLSAFAAPSQSGGAAAKPAVNVQEVDLEGLKKLIDRSPKANQPLLVNFWATWCDPCREEFPDLVKIDQEYRSKGLDFVSISLDDKADIKTTVPNFLRQMKATMPVYVLTVSDPDPAIHYIDDKWSGALPATFLYDGQGKVVYKILGSIKPAELRTAIDKAIAK